MDLKLGGGRIREEWWEKKEYDHNIFYMKYNLFKTITLVK